MTPLHKKMFLTCKKCHEDLPLSCFRTPLGKKESINICYPCEESRTNNHKRYHRENKSKVRIKLINLLGDRCVCCGLDKWWILTVDRIVYSKSDIRETPHALYKKLVENPELLKEYQCLCLGCDKGKNTGGRCLIHHDLHLRVTKPIIRLNTDEHFWDNMPPSPKFSSLS